VVEGMLFLLDLGLMIYLSWKLIKNMRGESPDLGLFSFKKMEKQK
jgi:hypothetical protein